MRESKVTIKIPRPLYRKIQQVVEESGFDSPTDFIVYVLRDLMGDAEAEQAEPAGSTPAALAGGWNVLPPVAEENLCKEHVEVVAKVAIWYHSMGKKPQIRPRRLTNAMSDTRGLTSRM